jgi:hypothetical protein
VARQGNVFTFAAMMVPSTGSGAVSTAAASPLLNTSRMPRGFSNRSSGPVMPCSANSAACMPFCATSALAIDLAAEMSPKRTAVEVAARAPLSAIACASRCGVSRIKRPAIAGAASPETVTPSQAESRSIRSLQRPNIS